MATVSTKGTPNIGTTNTLVLEAQAPNFHVISGMSIANTSAQQVMVSVDYVAIDGVRTALCRNSPCPVGESITPSAVLRLCVNPGDRLEARTTAGTVDVLVTTYSSDVVPS